MKDAHRIDAFWDVMAGAYGARWKSVYGDHDNTGVWEKALAKYDASQIKIALAQAIKFYTQYPPTLGQFLDLCRKTPASMAFQLPRLSERSPRDKQRQWLDDLSGLLKNAKRRGPLSEDERGRIMREIGLDDQSIAVKRATHVVPGSRAACRYTGCSSPGVLMESTTGGDRWYCAKHFTGDFTGDGHV